MATDSNTNPENSSADINIPANNRVGHKLLEEMYESLFY